MRWLFLSVFLAAPVSAEPLPKLLDVVSEIEGREIQATGDIGRFGSSGAAILIDDSYFSITYALPREKLKIAEECKLEFFSGNRGCPATVFAEIVMDGADIDLLVFDIEFHEAAQD
ncbi:unnamed protein product [Laminaria digitata]